jgi:hypothetical protein
MSVIGESFHVSKDQLWEQLARELGAEIVKGDFWEGDKVVARHGSWVVTLDTFAISAAKSRSLCTRLRAPYENADGFRFKLYRKNPLSDVGKLLGMQDVLTGHAAFDEEFIVKSNDETKMWTLLSNAHIRHLIFAQPEILLQVKDDEGWFGSDFPEGVDELYFEAPGVIVNLERLESLFTLFAAVLDRLCEMGAAYESEPHVTL